MGNPFKPCDSMWQRTASPWPDTAPLSGGIKTDIAVVGSGYTGSSAALRMAEAGRDVVVLEAAEPGFGASGRNTGWWVPLWMGLTPQKAITRFGETAGSRFIQMMLDGTRLVPQLVKDYNIDCDLREVGVVCAASTKKTLNGLQQQAAEWRRWGGVVPDLGRSDMRRFIASDHYLGGIYYQEGGFIHPVKYTRGLAAAAQKHGAQIYTKSPVVSLEEKNGGWVVRTPQGWVEARQVLLATNAFPALIPQMKKKFIPLAIGMIASAPFPNRGRDYLPGDAMVTDMDTRDMFAVGFDADGRMTTSILPPYTENRSAAHIARHFWRMFRTVFPNAPKEVGWDSAWVGNICVPKDMLVKVGSPAEGLFMAFGYSGSGIAQATIVGREMADWILTGDRSRSRVPAMDIQPLPLAPVLTPLLNRVVLPSLNRVLYR